MPIVPPMIQEELDASKSYLQREGKCVFCNIIVQEAKGPRLIFENVDFIVFAPYASISPMAFWIVPKKHTANIIMFSPAEIASFAKTLKASLKALKDVVNDPPYNFGLHISIDKAAEEFYHWHLEVYPKLSIWAGFEISTGTYINTVTPEAAAESLKKTISL